MADHRIRLAFVGGEHLHFRGLLNSALESPTAEVVGMQIADDELRAYFATEYSGVPAFTSADELYDAAKPQAIITCADNAQGAEVVAEAAARGVHVMKEKPMAATLGLAEQMATTAARHGVRLMVNWPIELVARHSPCQDADRRGANRARSGRSTTAPVTADRRAISRGAVPFPASAGAGWSSGRPTAAGPRSTSARTARCSADG